jgi:hypothetical protein
MPAPNPHAATFAAPVDMAVVWIDSREASIVSWRDGHPTIERLTSDVPPHRRARGNVQHGPAGAGGDPEPRRLEHLARFVHDVRRRIPAQADVLVVGPGTVRWRLSAALRVQDEQRGNRRVIRCRPAPPWTARQLTAEFRRASGRAVRRRTAGAYRWSRPRASHGTSVVPVRLTATPDPGSHPRVTQARGH